MKKISLLLSFAAVLLAYSCTPEELNGPDVPDSYTLRAVISDGGVQTKAITVDNPGVRINTYWQAGDKIGVFGGSGGQQVFSLSAGDIAADGKSADFRSDKAVPSGTLSAYSPLQEGADVSGDQLVLQFPATQHYTISSGVSAPDPAANIMVASGSAQSGLGFRPVVAILKIGQAFDAETTVKSLEFKDLSGADVSGSLKVKAGSKDAPEISGGGKTLVLDCGDGVELLAGEMGRFFLVVPAREYAKGFEVTFVTAKGERFTKQAATSKGKKLECGMVYPVGELPAREYVASDAKVQLVDGAVLMDADNLDKIQILSREDRELSSGDRFFTLPAYKILADKSLGLKEGGWLVMEASEELPSGGVFTVTSLESFPGYNYDRISLEPETNPVQVYKQLEFGGTLWKEDGTVDEDGGVTFDLGAYLSGIQDADGNAVPFSVGPSGEILFSEEATEQLLGTKGLARMDKSITTPKISHQIGEDGCSVTLGACMTITMKAAARITNGELSFLHFTVHPVLNFSADFELSHEWTKSWEKSLITLYFVPGVPIAPGLVMEPNLNFSAGISVNASLKFSAGLSYNYDCGTLGCSYNAGDGFFLRYLEPSPGSAQVNPELDYDMEGSLSAGVHLGINPALHIWGLMEVGIDTDLSLNFDLYGSMSDGIKLALVPGISLTPRTAALGGWLTKKWDKLSLSLDLDPLWEGYLFPKGSWGFGKQLMTENVVTTVLSTDPDGTEHIKCCSIPYFRLAISNPIPTNVGFGWVADFETENLLLDWDMYLYIYTGSKVDYYVSPNYLTFSASMKDYGYDFTDYTGQFIKVLGLSDTGDWRTDDIMGVLRDARIERKVKLCHLGAGDGNEKQSGTAWPGFVSGQPYGYALAWVCGDEEIVMASERGPEGWFLFKPSPKFAGDDRSIELVETTDGSIIPGSGLYAFQLWWPYTPTGKPWWEERTRTPNDPYWWMND